MIMTKTYEVEITRIVSVTIDETKFTDEFLEEFSNYISSDIDDIDSHVEHLAWSFAMGRVDHDQFIEGYGPAKDFGIKFREVDDWVSEVREV